MKLEKKQPNITKELIFSKISPFDVYHLYIPDFAIKKTICSPLRKDNSPSFGVFVSDGNLVYKDLATGDTGNCITLVEKMFGLNFDKALHKIANDFCLVNGTDEYKRIISAYSKPVMSEKRHCLIQVQVKKFSVKGLQWWAKYLMTSDKLKQGDIYEIGELYINRRKIPIGKEELVFGYYYNSGWKIMFPERPKKEKWLSNIPLDTPGGLENLSKDHNTLIVKSKKCYEVMRAVYPHICYVQNEGLGSVTEKTATYITENSREVFYGGDSDKVGKEKSYEITKTYNWKHVNTPDALLPTIKDWSDWVCEAQSYEPVIAHLQKKKVIV